MTNTLPVTEMNQRINASIYIPRVRVYYSEADIRRALYFHGIGNIVSMDFIPIHKKPGFREHIRETDKYMSVFIHFYNPDEQPKNIAFWSPIFHDQPVHLTVGVDEYWICLRNKKFVPRTWMNIHQVAENGRLLEEQVEAQGKRIDELEALLRKTLKMISVSDIIKEYQTDYQNAVKDEQNIRECIQTSTGIEKSMYMCELDMVVAEKDAIKENFEEAIGEPLSKYM